MSTEKIMGKVNSWESFGAADGPGLRYVIFLQGCHMRCKYCHNPETWSLNGGEEISAEDAFKKVMRYKNYWGSNFDKAKGRITGGITISGGEALLQIDFVTEVFRLAKEQGVHTTLDTSGNPFTFEEPFKSKFDKLMEVTDLFMLDIKEIEDDKHKELTKWTNINILEMAKYLSDNGKEMWIRHVLVPGITDDEEGLKKLKSFVDDLKTVSKVEILPYHTLGLEKWKNLKFDYPLEGVKTPTKLIIGGIFFERKLYGYKRVHKRKQTNCRWFFWNLLL